MNGGRGHQLGRSAILVLVIVAGLGLGYVTRPSRAASQGPAAGASVVERQSETTRSTVGSAVPGRTGLRWRPLPSNRMLVPGGPDYDPAAAAIALELDVNEVFAAEKRDPAFADRREKAVAEHLAQVVGRHAPEVEVIGVECRTGSCRAVFEAPDDGWSPELVQRIAWGSLTGTEEVARDGGRIGFEVTTLMNRDLLDHATYERFMSQWRTETGPDLEHLREQRTAPR